MKWSARCTESLVCLTQFLFSSNDTNPLGCSTSVNGENCFFLSVFIFSLRFNFNSTIFSLQLLCCCWPHFRAQSLVPNMFSLSFICTYIFLLFISFSFHSTRHYAGNSVSVAELALMSLRCTKCV